MQVQSHPSRDDRSTGEREQVAAVTPPSQSLAERLILARVAVTINVSFALAYFVPEDCAA